MEGLNLFIQVFWAPLFAPCLVALFTLLVKEWLRNRRK